MSLVGQEAVLLDEELALLVPDTQVLPWLGRLAEGDQDAALRTAARGLLARGLARQVGPDLQALAPLNALLAPFGGGSVLQLVSVVEGQRDVVLTGLRPLPDGELLAHDVSEDGVHRLTALPHEAAVALLVEGLAPLGGGSEPDAPALEEGGVPLPRATARVSLVRPGAPDLDLALTTLDSGVYLVDERGAGLVTEQRLVQCASALVRALVCEEGAPRPAAS